MSQTNLNVTEVVQSLGGHPRSDEAANLELLANEIVILRQKLTDAGHEDDRFIDVEAAASRTKVEAAAAGAPIRHVLPDATRETVGS